MCLHTKGLAATTAGMVLGGLDFEKHEGVQLHQLIQQFHCYRN